MKEKAKFIAEVELGNTQCENCPFRVELGAELFCADDAAEKFQCDHYNLATLKITKQTE